MINLDLIKYSLRNLNSRKSRSFLTIISIFVGITTIFLFVSFGWGLYDYIDSITSSSAVDKIVIQTKGSGVAGLDDTISFSQKDLNAVERTAGVYVASPIYMKSAEIKQDRIKRYVWMMGIDSKKNLIEEMSNLKIVSGRKLSSGDKNKVVLGYNYMVEDIIFPKKYELNDKINVQGVDLRVIGFYESLGNPQDDSSIYVIDDTFKEMYPNSTNKFSWIIAKVDKTQMDTVISRVEKKIRDSRELEEGKEDFFVASFEELLDTYTSVLDIIIWFIIFIALISVFVSTINTANTMITSVIERYKEIGIMKAVGARNQDILGIFLFESGFLGFIAGCIGVFVGVILSETAKSVLLFYGYGFLKPHYSFVLFAGAIVFATFTGIISGILPAIKASKLKAVDSLRFE
ncbi:MAG TPA: ABC transporter permease [Candidatus Paceibacterota bacterium]|nr:ABC transporter permease [Candidatus Paceibacterota bacterium]